MASYMVIVIITLIIGVLGYREAVRIVEDEVQTANLAVLEQIKDIMDSILTDCETVAFQIAMNPKVNALSSVKEPFKLPFYYELKELVDSMSLYTLKKEYLETAFVYLKNSQYIITPETVYKADFFYQQVFNYNDMNFSEWLSLMLDSNNNRKYLPNVSTTVHDKEQTVIPYLQSIPIGYKRNNAGTVIILIKRDEIYNLLKRINKFGEGWFYIESKHGGIITSIAIENHQIEHFNWEFDSAKKGSIETTVNGKNMMVTYTNSDYNDWRYVLSLPTKTVMLKANYIKQLTWVILLISLLLGAVVAYLLALHSARPLDGIIKSLKEFAGDQNPQNKKTFEFLKGSINELIRNNKDLQESMNKQMPFLEAAFYTGLFKGEYCNKNEIETVSSYIGLKIKGMAFLVLILRLYGYDDTNNVDENILEEWNLTKIVVKKTIKKYMNTEYISDIDNSNIAIIVPFTTNEHNKCEEETEKIVGIVYDQLHQLYNLKVFFAAGNIYADLLETDQSYERARQVLDSKLKYNNSIIVWYNDMPKQSEGYHYPIEIEHKIMNFAKSGEIEKVEKQLEFIYNENFINRKLYVKIEKDLINEMRGTIIKLLSQGYYDGDQSKLINSINVHDSVHNVYENIKLVYQKICNKVIEQRNNNNIELINGIIEYINANYMQPDICLYKVASQFGMSEGYLSRFFKDSTGENFTKYVENIRIYYACSLLKENRYTINDIAGRVGYNSIQSFRRAFKRQNGVSPSDFRQCIK